MTLTWEERYEIGKKWERLLVEKFSDMNINAVEYELRDEYGALLPQRYFFYDLEDEFHPDIEVEWDDGSRVYNKLVEVKYQGKLYENWGLVSKNTLSHGNKFLYVKKEHFDSYKKVGKSKDIDWDIWFAVPTRWNKFIWFHQDGRYLDRLKIKCKNPFGGDEGWFYMFDVENFFKTKEFSA